MASKRVHFPPELISGTDDRSGYNAPFADHPFSITPSPAAHHSNGISLAHASPTPPSGLYFQHKHSPPFRTGGRGSKQLSKAIEYSSVEKGTQSGISNDMWVLHDGDPIYFAKVVSPATQDASSVLVQKMQPSHIDPALLVPWEGHLVLAKIESLQPIQVSKGLLIPNFSPHTLKFSDEKGARGMANIRQSSDQPNYVCVAGSHECTDTPTFTVDK
jgi:hypothetical protein